MAQADGSIQHLPSKLARLTFVRTYDAPADQVWAAITDPEKIAAWWAVAEQLDLTGGGRFVLRWLNSDEEGYQPVATGRISALDPGRIIEYNTDVFGALRFVLAPADDGGTKLTFTSTLPLSPSWEAKMLAGWHWRFDALADALKGQAVDWTHWPLAEWVAHRRRYADKLSWGG